MSPRSAPPYSPPTLSFLHLHAACHHFYIHLLDLTMVGCRRRRAPRHPSTERTCAHAWPRVAGSARQGNKESTPFNLPRPLMFSDLSSHLSLSPICFLIYHQID
ncbi:hypothetical protein PVAP13_1KG249215 [Panicum virgatum]|uniref:Uncharacterized protein n=1 Tax=Panicum virgatum TaxID=38727 RepID=A0A8T0XK29_PANVG|nr:hypothetical protein PVAP13_1KG249215 [Panicum virgatum]